MQANYIYFTCNLFVWYNSQIKRAPFWDALVFFSHIRYTEPASLLFLAIFNMYGY